MIFLLFLASSTFSALSSFHKFLAFGLPKRSLAKCWTDTWPVYFRPIGLLMFYIMFNTGESLVHETWRRMFRRIWGRSTTSLTFQYPGCGKLQSWQMTNIGRGKQNQEEMQEMRNGQKDQKENLVWHTGEWSCSSCRRKMSDLKVWKVKLSIDIQNSI